MLFFNRSFPYTNGKWFEAPNRRIYNQNGHFLGFSCVRFNLNVDSIIKVVIFHVRERGSREAGRGR